jgi:hypothetical protein
MVEVDKACIDGPTTVARSHSTQVSNGVTAYKFGVPINEDGQVFGPEGDKERSIIKAALSITEICRFHLVFSRVLLSFRRRFGGGSHRANK